MQELSETLPRFEGIETPFSPPCTTSQLRLKHCPDLRGLRHAGWATTRGRGRSETLPRFEGIETWKLRPDLQYPRMSETLPRFEGIETVPGRTLEVDKFWW